MKLTPEQLREITDRCEKATPGPWEFVGSNQAIYTKDSLVILTALPNRRPNDVDANFIASSRADIPSLLDHIKALEEENARYKGGIDKALKIFWDAFYDDNNPIEPDHAYHMRDVLRNSLKGADEE